MQPPAPPVAAGAAPLPPPPTISQPRSSLASTRTPSRRQLLVSAGGLLVAAAGGARAAAAAAGGQGGGALVGYDGPVVTEADRVASAAVSRRVGEAVGLLELGRELQARGEFSQALASFTRVVRDYADLALSEYARVGRALVLYEIGDRDESIAEMEDVSITLKGYPGCWGLELLDAKRRTNLEQCHSGGGETVPANKAVASTETRQKFPVLLRVTAVEEKKSSTPRHVGVDIVALLDISGSMSYGEKLDSLKEAMKIVINKLGPKDRLSIVPFESKVNRLTELTYMSEQGKKAAQDKIEGLVAGGENVMGEALKEGAQILRGRREDEKSSRVGCIMFLSDGIDTDIFSAPISRDFPAHTFGLGADHDPRVMKLIADKTSGTYSFVNNDVAKIKDAFELFIAGLTSVAATSVEITLRAHEGASISEISSGGYLNEKSSDGGSGAIYIDNMSAGEKKNFIVYLQLEPTEEGKQKLLTIGGRYKSPGSASKNLASIDVTVMRPDKNKGKGGADGPQPALFDHVPEVKEEEARVKLFTGISGVVPPMITAETQVSKEGLEKAWTDFQESDEGKGAPQTMMENFAKDYDKMKSGIDDANEHRKSGLPYLMSWLTSHKWQRATTKDELPSPGSTGDFLTQRQKDVVQKTQDGKESKDATTTTAEDDAATPTWEKIKKQARSHLGSFLRHGVAVVLASLLLMMLYSALEGGSMAKNIAPLQYPMLSKTNYPAWAIKMEAYMRAQGVWDAIEAKDPKKVPARKNQMALAAIYQAIPEGTLFLLSGKKTAKSAWEALKTMHIGAKRLRDAKMQTLKLELLDRSPTRHGLGP